jgi:putative component of membrane protein insertase Oxa1/YidC/SpoIIIJ protein YidD
MSLTHTVSASAQSADLLIAGYQRFLSPYKGFCCAYRVHTGRASCSSLGRRVIRTHGLFSGLVLLTQRFKRCKASALALNSGAGAAAEAADTADTPDTPNPAGAGEPAAKKKSSCSATDLACCADISACACAPFT